MCQSNLGVIWKRLPNLVLCTDYVMICFDCVLYTIAWVTTEIVSGLFIDYARIIYFIKFIYRSRQNKKIYILTSLEIYSQNIGNFQCQSLWKGADIRYCIKPG